MIHEDCFRRDDSFFRLGFPVFARPEMLLEVTRKAGSDQEVRCRQTNFYAGYGCRNRTRDQHASARAVFYTHGRFAFILSGESKAGNTKELEWLHVQWILGIFNGDGLQSRVSGVLDTVCFHPPYRQHLPGFRGRQPGPPRTKSAGDHGR